jgi:hypothetical protein
VQPIAATAHHLDDLLSARRVGRVPMTLTAGPASREIARHGGRRAAATERIQRR